MESFNETKKFFPFATIDTTKQKQTKNNNTEA